MKATRWVGAVRVDVQQGARTRADQLPMRVQVADRAVAFELEPRDEADELAARSALTQLGSRGAKVAVQPDLRGTISHPNSDSVRKFLIDALAAVRFSGDLTVGGDRLEYRDGECRVGGWEHLPQVEARFVAAEDHDAEVLIAVLEAVARRPDVADLDVDTTRGGFRVLASVAEPTGFLEDLREAVRGAGFCGAADLSVAGRWRFAPDGAVRLDQGVPL